jgi:hypothetical protein
MVSRRATAWRSVSCNLLRRATGGSGGRNTAYEGIWSASVGRTVPNQFDAVSARLRRALRIPIACRFRSARFDFRSKWPGAPVRRHAHAAKAREPPGPARGPRLELNAGTCPAPLRAVVRPTPKAACGLPMSQPPVLRTGWMRTHYGSRRALPSTDTTLHFPPLDLCLQLSIAFCLASSGVSCAQETPALASDMANALCRPHIR